MKTWTPIIGALAAAAVLAVSGCGGSDGDGGNGNAAKTSPATGSEGAKQGGVLRIGTVDAITSFNPFIALSLQTGTAINATYAALVQTTYDPDKGFSPVPDFAKSWEVSKGGKRITFKVHEGAKFSDGKPMTAEDAAWSMNTIAKFGDGPTGQVAYLLEGFEKATAPDATTVVVDYESPQPNALISIAQGIQVLPKHIWEKHAQGNGRGMRTYRPESQAGGLVSGGPYLLKQFEKSGTTAFIPNPEFYGPKSNAEAVTLTYYTNEDSMVEDFMRDQLDVMESVPTGALKVVEANDNATVKSAIRGLQGDLFMNSNPRKPKNRELLDPSVREAIASCIDRDQIIDVVFQGHAKKVETLVGTLGGPDQNTDLPAREYDCAAGNEILDELGYERGKDGIRVAPATTGQYAQGAHPMSYEIVTVAGAGEFNVDRTTEILRKGLEELGVKVVQKVAGDETATNTYLTGADCDPATSTGYTSWDFDLAYSVAEITAVDTLSSELKDSWCAWNFSGFDNPKYDALWAKAAVELDADKRRELLHEMQKIYYDAGAAIPLAEQEAFSAYSNRWAGFIPPELTIGSKLYYTAPYMVE